MGSSNDANDAVDQALDRGRKSARLQRALRAGALGLSVALASLTALLLVGTSWFPTPLLWLGMVGGFGAAAVSWQKSRLSNYEIARILDCEWQSNDQVSTACYFAEASDEDSAVVQAQRELAVGSAANRDAGEALPLQATPEVWAAAVLLFAVVALTGMRYSVTPTLALESALTPALLSGESQGEQGATPENHLGKNAEAASNDKTATEGEELAEARERVDETASPFDPLLMGNEDASPAEAEAEGLDKSPSTGDELDFQQPSDEAGMSEGEQGNAADEQGSNLERPGDSSEQIEQDASWSEESNSMLDRLKDALQQLRENLASEPAQATSGEEATPAEEGSDSAASPQAGEQSSSPDAEGAGAEADASMESTEPAQSAQQTAEGGNSSGGEDSDGGGDSAGGAGSGDGSKEILEQQVQEAAFEALEEFYLQRAEELSGDVLSETNTGEVSAAATPYNPQLASSREGAGVAVRDEAPAAYRTFVENYFREIRSK